MAGPFELVGGFAGGWAGGEVGVLGGGAAGTLVEPGGGTVVGGIAGGVIGRRLGAAGGRTLGAWADNKLGLGDQSLCGGNCAAAERAPGQPTEKDKFIPKKNWDGKKVAAPNGRGYGYPDANGNVWVPTGPDGSPAAHGGEHWDVQSLGGGYTNVYPGGITRGGLAPYPVLP